MSDRDLSLLEYEGNGFNKRQLQEIELGVVQGLSSAQVNMYAKLEFNSYQMCQIRVGLENGLSLERVAYFAKPEFDEFQMSVIRVGFELGMSLDEVSAFANPEFSWQKMFRMRTQLRQKDSRRVSLGEAISAAEKHKGQSGAPEHYKQEGFEL